MFPLQPGEKVNVVLPLTGGFRSFPADHFIFMATAQGVVKKTSLDEFSNPRKAGIIAVDLDDGDYLIGAALTDGVHDVMLFSDGGKAVRFDEKDVRAVGRGARGVRGMALDATQSVIAMLVAEDETQSVLTATENGYGKRTRIAEYTRHGRGTKGMIAIQQTERNGKVVAATLVRPDDEIMLITDSGVLVRTRVSEIRELGRATQGVTLIALDDDAKLIGLQRIVENDAAEEPGAEGDAGPRRRRREPLMHRATIYLGGACAALALAASALAQGTPAQASPAKKALVQKVLQSQQPEIENVSRSIVERPAALMLQQASRALQAVPADKREAMGKAIDVEARKYVDEAYPLVRERALRIAPTTVGAVLEAKMSEDELKQLVAWLESPTARKYQQLSDEMRESFVQKLLADAQPVVDPKLQALDGRVRVILGLPRAPTAPATAPMPARSPAKAASMPARAASK